MLPLQRRFIFRAGGCLSILPIVRYVSRCLVLSLPAADACHVSFFQAYTRYLHVNDACSIYTFPRAGWVYPAVYPYPKAYFVMSLGNFTSGYMDSVNQTLHKSHLHLCRKSNRLRGFLPARFEELPVLNFPARTFSPFIGCRQAIDVR